jgi:hypothetical protein
MALTGVNRRALMDGRLRVSLFTTRRDSSAQNGTLTLPATIRVGLNQ